MENSLNFLAQTDEAYAEGKMELERSEILRKRVRSRIFMTGSGTVAERQAQAECHQDAVEADSDYVLRVGAFETLKAKRQRAELVIEVFRTLEASRRKTAHG